MIGMIHFTCFIFTVLSSSFSLAAFNCHGLKSSISYVLDLSNGHDIVFVCEHWLRVSEINTIRNIFEENDKLSYLQSSIDPLSELHGRPHGGTGFICTKKRDVAYKVIDYKSDRLHGLQVIVKGNMVLSVIGVYLPFNDSTLGNTELFIDILENLQCIIDQCDNQAPIIVMGDTNTVLPSEQILKDRWYSKKPYNKHSAIFYEFLKENEMTVANFMFPQDINYTYHQGEKCSYIDHVIIPEYFSENITECRILSNAQDNVSDHISISITFSLQIHYPYYTTNVAYE